jgi:hypothetical protein
MPFDRLRMRVEANIPNPPSSLSHGDCDDEKIRYDMML